MTVQDFWLDYEKAAQRESGGGGVVARVRINTGYKVYVSGMPQDATFFPADPKDEAAAAVAKKAAQSLGGDPKWVLCIRAFLDGAYSRGTPATWRGDQFHTVQTWTPAAKEVVVPSLQEHGIAIPWDGWVRLGFKPDPHFEAKGEAGKTKTDAEGNPKFPTVAYVTEVFEDEAAALAAVGITAVATSAAPVSAGGNAPDGWDVLTYGQRDCLREDTSE